MDFAESCFGGAEEGGEIAEADWTHLQSGGDSLRDFLSAEERSRCSALVLQRRVRSSEFTRSHRFTSRAAQSATFR